MIITSVVLLAAAVGLLIIGAVQGNPTMLEVSLGAGAAGALALYAGNASARRIALARGVPVEAVLASRLRRTPPGPAAPSGETAGSTEATVTPPTEAPPPPPIDGYDDMPAREVTRLIFSGALPDAALSEMLVYEASHRRRRSVLTALLDTVGPDRARTETRTRPHQAAEHAGPT
ncbi:MAG TPA: hypothetical protein VGL32_14120 [Acidimicrobiales bacterium]